MLWSNSTIHPSLFPPYSSTGLTRTVSYEPHRDLVTSVEHQVGQTTLSAYGYSNDAIGRRTAMARSGTAFAAADTISYGYNDRSEVTSAESTLFDGNNYKYNYQYDPIGNRLSENHNGNISNYTANSLNQYTERTVPGVFDFLGSANPAATVTVTSPADSASPSAIHASTRQGPYWHAAVPVTNTAAAVHQSAKATGVLKGQGTGGKDIVTEQNLGSFFVPRTPEAFTYDADGNLTADGRWVYTWDAENRLIQAENPTVKIENRYDYQSRRVEKKKYTRADAAQAWQLVKQERFLYNGFRLFESFTYDPVANATTLQAFTWDDLRDELLAVHDVAANATYLVAHDANRNVTELVSPAGEIKAHYEYGPFGQPLVQTGAYAARNPFRFSSEQYDADLALVYYNYRYYNPQTARWHSRDPMEERGSSLLYGFCGNDPINAIDLLGLQEFANPEWHHRVVQKYKGYVSHFYKVNAAENGWILEKAEHQAISRIVEKHWDNAIANLGEKDITQDVIDKVLSDIDKEIEPILTHHLPAPMSYSKWGKGGRSAFMSGGLSKTIKVGGKAFKLFAVWVSVMAYQEARAAGKSEKDAINEAAWESINITPLSVREIVTELERTSNWNNLVKDSIDFQARGGSPFNGYYGEDVEYTRSLMLKEFLFDSCTTN